MVGLHRVGESHVNGMVRDDLRLARRRVVTRAVKFDPRTATPASEKFSREFLEENRQISVFFRRLSLVARRLP